MADGMGVGAAEAEGAGGGLTLFTVGVSSSLEQPLNAIAEVTSHAIAHFVVLAILRLLTLLSTPQPSMLGGHPIGRMPRNASGSPIFVVFPARQTSTRLYQPALVCTGGQVRRA